MYAIRARGTGKFYSFSTMGFHSEPKDELTDEMVFRSMDELAQHFGNRAQAPMNHREEILDSSTEVVVVVDKVNVPHYKVVSVLP